MPLRYFILAFLSLFIFFHHVAFGKTTSTVQKRLEADIVNGKPIVAHVIVALCDNIHQGIVPVPKALGDGQNPRTNLYWGAMYGFRTYFIRRAGYRLLVEKNNPNPGILQKVIFYKSIERSGIPRNVFIVGEAWDGKKMKDSINRFLRIAAGNDMESQKIRIDQREVDLSYGGMSALVGFVGHNGLMDFTLDSEPISRNGVPARSSVVLACSSKPYFLDLLKRGGSHPLLLTTGLMAPEAYTLDAIIKAFVAGKPPSGIRDTASAAYHKYQKCGLKAAKKLFVTNCTN